MGEKSGEKTQREDEKETPKVIKQLRVKKQHMEPNNNDDTTTEKHKLKKKRKMRRT